MLPAQACESTEAVLHGGLRTGRRSSSALSRRCLALASRRLHSEPLPARLRERDVDESSLGEQKHECKGRRHGVDVELNGAEDVRERGGCEVGANGRPDAEADGESDADVGEGGGALGRCGDVG